jgi:hypothetical protein
VGAWWRRWLIGSVAEPEPELTGWDEFMARVRRLERPCDRLVDAVDGDPITAYWYGIADGGRCIALERDGRWLEVVLERDGPGGKVLELDCPDRSGVPLRRAASTSLPSPEALRFVDDPAIAGFLGNPALARRYDQVWMDAHPFMSTPEPFAVAGGWSWTWADSEDDEFIGTELVVLTLRDSEPWVEVLLGPTGYHVFQRIT